MRVLVRGATAPPVLAEPPVTRLRTATPGTLTMTRPEPADGPGRLENGWCRLAPDVLRAFFGAVGGNRGHILAEVILRTWGVAWWVQGSSIGPPPAVVPCQLNLSELARAVGVSQPNMVAARNSLVRDGLVVLHPDGSLEPGKHFDQWPSLQAAPQKVDFYRAGADLMREVRAEARASDLRATVARKRLRVAKPPDEEGVPDPLHLSGQTAAGVYGQPDRCSDHLYGQPDSTYMANHIAPICPTRYPLYGQPDRCRGPILNSDLIREGEINSRPPAHPREGRDNPAVEAIPDPIPAAPPETPPPPSPEPEPPPAASTPIQAERGPSRKRQAQDATPYLPGDVVPDDRMLDMACARYAEWFPTTAMNWQGAPASIPRQIARHRYVFPSGWFLKVLKRLHLEGRHPDPGWPLLFAILRSWEGKGAPERGLEDEYDDDLRLIPRSQRTDAPRPGRPLSGSMPIPPEVRLTPEERARMRAAPPVPTTPGVSLPGGLVSAIVRATQGAANRNGHKPPMPTPQAGDGG